MKSGEVGIVQRVEDTVTVCMYPKYGGQIPSYLFQPVWQLFFIVVTHKIHYFPYLSIPFDVFVVVVFLLLLLSQYVLLLRLFPYFLFSSIFEFIITSKLCLGYNPSLLL